MLGRQEWFNMGKPIDVIHNINRTWRESHSVISIDPRRHLTKCIAYPFMTKKKFLSANWASKEFCQHDKEHSWLTSHSVVKEGEPSFPRSKTKQGWPLSSPLLSILLEVLARAIWQEKKKKPSPKFPRKSKLFSVAGDMGSQGICYKPTRATI